MALAFAPRVMLILAWVFSDRWDRVWDGWIMPVLGIIFAPYTTIMYMLVWTPNGVEGWDWMLFSALVSLALGLMIWAQFPLSGAWAIGALFGVRLIMTGWMFLFMDLAGGD